VSYSQPDRIYLIDPRTAPFAASAFVSPSHPTPAPHQGGQGLRSKMAKVATKMANKMANPKLVNSLEFCPR
jgi:hypothetical protein